MTTSTITERPATAAGRSRLILTPASLLRHWHLLSLDAPSVAVAWGILIARMGKVSVPHTSWVAMFIAVWILYVADRVLDAREAFASDLEARHIFHAQHQRMLLATVCAAAPVLGWLVLRLPERAIALYTTLAVLMAVYFIIIHARAVDARRLPKEFAVGIFFPAAVFIPTVARTPALQQPLLPHALLLSLLCTLNCLCIYAWEHEPPRLAASTMTRWGSSHLTLLGGVGLCTSIALLHNGYWPLSAAAATSFALLLVLNGAHRRMGRVTVRALADLVLLSPLLFLAVL